MVRIPSLTLPAGRAVAPDKGTCHMNEKETKTAVLDEALVREIVSEGRELPAGESRVVKVDRDQPAADVGNDEAEKG